MEQKIPNKPDCLTTEEFTYILQRDGHQCALYAQCRSTGQARFCSDSLDFDHHHPQCLGGDNSFANMRLLCSGKNRGRPVESSPYWNELNYWDGAFDASRLRNIQALAGRDAILDPALAGFVANHRDVLLENITLVVGATGTGKTIIIQSKLSAINLSVNNVGPGRPRIKHVLWFTPEQTLRDLTIRELEDEAFDLSMVETRPIVRRAENYADLVKGPNGAAITVACPHSLWNVGGEDQQLRRNSNQMRDVLSQYDTIVFDEVDQANGQVLYIVEHATNALKFSVTASPLIIDGVDQAVRERFMSRFVLIHNSAVADYRRAVMLDGCLKLFSSERVPEDVTIRDLIVESAGHNAHDSLSSGSRKTVDMVAEADHAPYLATILEAVCRADQLEQDMRRESPEQWYSPHIMVRMNNIADIRAMMKTLPKKLDELQAAGLLKGAGWAPTPIYQGVERHKDNPITADERDLSAKDKRGNYRHPFMRSKNTHGQVTVELGAKRILLMCNIGIRGINNWPILYLVDNTPASSVALLIQLLGRAMRWPGDRTFWHSKVALTPFLAVKVFVPKCLLTPEKQAGWTQALHFILNMEQQVSGAAFRSWADLIQDQDHHTAAIPDFGPDAQPLTRVDEFKIIDTIGSLAPIPPQNIDTTIASVMAKFGIISPKKAERIERYSRRLIGDDDFRKKVIGATAMNSTAKPVDCTACLKPKDHYEQDELIRHVMDFPTYKSQLASYIERIKANDPLIVPLIEDKLRAIQKVLYREPGRIFQLQKTGDEPGILSSLSNEIFREIGDVLLPCHHKEIFKATSKAAQKVYGIDTAANNGPMNQHAYHVAIMGRDRNKIRDVAINYLVRWNFLPNFTKLHDME